MEDREVHLRLRVLLLDASLTMFSYGCFRLCPHDKAFDHPDLSLVYGPVTECGQSVWQGSGFVVRQ